VPNSGAKRSKNKKCIKEREAEEKEKMKQAEIERARNKIAPKGKKKMKHPFVNMIHTGNCAQ